MERPCDLLARAHVWSNYKHHSTVKVLMGITPQGTISFISKCYGGRISDKEIVEHSNLIDHLLPGNNLINLASMCIVWDFAQTVTRLPRPGRPWQWASGIVFFPIHLSAYLANHTLPIISRHKPPYQTLTPLITSFFQFWSSPNPLDFLSCCRIYVCMF